MDPEGSAGGSPAVTIVSPAPPDVMPAATAESNTAAVSHHRSVLCCQIILWCTALALHAHHTTEKLHACKACLLLDSMQAVWMQPCENRVYVNMSYSDSVSAQSYLSHTC